MGQEAAQIIVGAVTLGCIYGLVGVGFVILYRSTGVVSFAQGSFMLVGALVFYSLTASLGWSLIPGLLCATVIMGVIGAGSYLVVFGHVFDSKPFTISVATIALGTLIAAITALIWGSTILTLPNLISFNAIHLPLELTVTPVNLFTIALAVVVIGSLMVVLKRTARSDYKCGQWQTSQPWRHTSASTSQRCQLWRGDSQPLLPGLPVLPTASGPRWIRRRSWLSACWPSQASFWVVSTASAERWLEA